MTIYEDGSFYLEKGEVMPCICPKCNHPEQIENSNAVIVCRKCGHAGPRECFQAVLVLQSAQ